MTNLIFRILLAAVIALGAWQAPAAADTARTQYGLDYSVRFVPESGLAQVSIKHTPGTGALRRLELSMPEARYTEVRGDGKVSRDGATVTWVLPTKGPGTLRFSYRVNKKRRSGGYDARMTDDWVIVRGDHLFPSARVRATAGAESRARLRVLLPEGWTGADTAFPRSEDRRHFIVENPERSFSRPVGWMIAGTIGARREQLGDTHVSVAGPKGDVVRRNDMLAFFNGLVPEFKEAFGKLPQKLLVVSAGDPMWRGGLSGPNSLFLHADRPLISENGTSTLTHELVHVITRIRGAESDDWITEGLAEFYSIEMLRRAGLLSDARADRAHEWMANHGKAIKSLSHDRAYGPRTARSVQLFRELDAEIRERTDDKHDLDDIVRALIPLRVISREDLREQVRELTGTPSRVLATPLLD
jgi:predicted metalloprotease with PDZ domain